MAVTLAELADLVGGTLVGPGDLEIAGAATLSTAGPHDITFIDSIERLPRLEQNPAAAVVVPRVITSVSRPCVQVDDVHAAFAKIVGHFRPVRPQPRTGISPAAVVSPSAHLAHDVDVHPGATIGDDVTIGACSTIHAGARIMAGCRIAENVTIFPNAVLYENTIVGPRAIVHANAVLGAYGFGYVSTSGKHQLSAQLGYVELAPTWKLGPARRSTVGRTARR